jgi:hypothetical protein
VRALPARGEDRQHACRAEFLENDLIHVRNWEVSKYPLMHWRVDRTTGFDSFLSHDPVARRVPTTGITSCELDVYDNDQTHVLTDEKLVIDECIFSDQELRSQARCLRCYNDCNCENPLRENNCGDREEIDTEWTFSVVYSHTWRCPVLYFTVTAGPDGSAIFSRDFVLHTLRTLHHSNRQGPDEDSWEFLSVEEHPIFGTPTFMLHPCRTEQRLDVMVQSNSNGVIKDDAARLLTWMSMILPSVGFGIPSLTFLHLRQALYSAARDAD